MSTPAALAHAAQVDGRGCRGQAPEQLSVSHSEGAEGVGVRETCVYVCVCV